MASDYWRDWHIFPTLPAWRFNIPETRGVSQFRGSREAAVGSGLLYVPDPFSNLIDLILLEGIEPKSLVGMRQEGRTRPHRQEKWSHLLACAGSRMQQASPLRHTKDSKD